MNLTSEQLIALTNGKPVRVTLEQTPCVILREDVYKCLQDALIKDSDMAPRESYAAVLKAWDQQDENPQQYLKYLED